MSNQSYFLALNHIDGVGPKTVGRLLEIWPDLEEVFKLSAKQIEQAGFSGAVARAISTFDFKTIEADLLWQENKHCHLLTLDDVRYPTLLKEIYDPPPVLYAQGDLNALQQPAVAMVGSRKPSLTGGETARAFAFELAGKHLTVVSGLALGIDAQAHLGCLQAKGRTIAVMATGVNHIYPRRHTKLAEQIMDNGLIISEFSLDTTPVPGHFPRRNRIISGLSLATLVVEAAIKSGSLITARMALEQNRDVLAVPGSIHNPQSRGCHKLLQQGAKLATCSDDVINEIFPNESPVENIDTSVSLAKDDTNLVKFIGFEVTAVDQIILRSGFSVDEVACGLAQLELEGRIKAVPGGYMRCVI